MTVNLIHRGTTLVSEPHKCTMELTRRGRVGSEWFCHRRARKEAGLGSELC